MIKFFRKIRQNLLSEGKTGKYFKYATGEIVLVVIGILIALQVNTWNQSRLEINKEKAYLRNIEADLKQQLSYISIQLEHEYEHDSIGQMILDRYNKEKVLRLDSTLSQQLNALTIRNTFIKADPTYQDLISTGNIRLIKDEKLRNEILSYYMELERIESIMMNNNLLYVDEMFAMKIIHNVYIGKTNERLIKVSNQLMQDPKQEMLVMNLLDIRKSITTGHIQFMNELKEKTELIQESVQQYTQ
ncbi:MAG: hypothetical protein CMB99_02075 [Flavobacteriaceae bacterium]|nr:hypothetical protein [Flavobacteriaceae bacterium]|tara:strand:- start:57923 stop:58657 length:735 start_codon:yes stop_codon:yes gene_type:complete